jgi:hypothetical protein
MWRADSKCDRQGGQQYEGSVIESLHGQAYCIWTQAKDKVKKRTYGTLGLDACVLAVLALLGSEAAGCFGQDVASVG